MIDDVQPHESKKKHTPPLGHIAVDSEAKAQSPASEPFKTPEEVAETSPPMKDEKLSHQTTNDESRWQSLRQWRPTRKQWIIIAIVAVLLIGGGTTWALTRTPKKPMPVASATKAAPNKPATGITLVSNLTGLPIPDASVNQRPVTGVMIENSDDARPQSGLDQAGVVFEAVAEAGITRFLALFQDSAPAYIGPVRSARPYYLQWCLGFDCAYAHVGGSPDALSDIPAWGVKDLDEFANGSSYERISSRAAPHNVYTSMYQLNQLEAKKGFGTPSYTGFLRKPDAPVSPAKVTSIDMNPSSADFASHYDYDATANNYKRSEGGAPHMELDSSGNKTQITPKVVIAMVVPESQGALDASGAYYSEYAAIGSGQAFVFEDGTYYAGTWTKTAAASQITFTDAAGSPIKLDAGQTWITALGSASDVSYK